MLGRHLSIHPSVCNSLAIPVPAAPLQGRMLNAPLLGIKGGKHHPHPLGGKRGWVPVWHWLGTVPMPWHRCAERVQINPVPSGTTRPLPLGFPEVIYSLCPPGIPQAACQAVMEPTFH